MRPISALLYLEGHMLLNRVHQIARRPGRLIIWALFVLWFGSFLFFRATRPHDFTSTLPYQLGLLSAFVPGLVLILLGMQVVIGCRRPPAAFAYPADARFLFGSRLPSRLVVFWLQLREAFFSGTRMFFVLFVSAWAFARSPAGLFTTALALATMYITMFGARLPAFLANRRMPGLRVPLWGAAIVGAGALSLVYSVFQGARANDFHLLFLARHTLQLPPGTWLIEAFHGQFAPLVLLCVLATLVVSVGSLASEDAYPELWEASARLYAFRSLAASGRILWNREALRKLRDTDPTQPQRAAQSAASVSGERTPGGALTLLWKEWLALRRTPGGLRWPTLWLLGGAFAGYLAGIAALDLSIYVSIALIAPALNTTVVIGSQASVTLSAEIRRPIWWLAKGGLTERLLVWAAAGLLRVAPPLVLAEIVAGVVLQDWLLLAGALPLTVALLMLIRAIGLACYVILPGRNDLRGPGFLLRLFATYLLLVPPAVVWAVLQYATQEFVVGAIGGLLFAAVETYALVSFAAGRLQDNAMAFAVAEEG